MVTMSTYCPNSSSDWYTPESRETMPDRAAWTPTAAIANRLTSPTDILPAATSRTTQTVPPAVMAAVSSDSEPSITRIRRSRTRCPAFTERSSLSMRPRRKLPRPNSRTSLAPSRSLSRRP